MYSVCTIRTDSAEEICIKVDKKEDIWSIFQDYRSGKYKKCKIWEHADDEELTQGEQPIKLLYPINLDSGVDLTESSMVAVIDNQIISEGILKLMVSKPDSLYYANGLQVVCIDGSWQYVDARWEYDYKLQVWEHYKEGSPFNFLIPADSEGGFKKGFNSFKNVNGLYETYWGENVRVLYPTVTPFDYANILDENGELEYTIPVFDEDSDYEIV